MMKIKGLFSERIQFLIFLGLSVVVTVFTGIMVFTNNLSGFQRFFGDINPLVPIFFVFLLGIVLFSFLLSRGWFEIYKKGNLKRLFYSSSLAALFALPIILLDLRVVFPADLNILFPESLLFYPAMGYVVEIIFHVLPLSLLLMLMTSLVKKSYSKIIWPCLLIVALLEPIFQTILGFSKPYPLWIVVYSNGIHVFLINLSQLFIFKRYDFISMYSFRLVYYILWHIVWGYLRLELLF